MAIGGIAVLPVNLFNRLMTVELALPAILPGLLVALHYGVQMSRHVGATARTRGAGARPGSSAALPWSALVIGAPGASGGGRRAGGALRCLDPGLCR